MNIELLDILRCPFCGGRLELVSSMYHRSISDQIHDGILGCQCCIFPVVDGIPVLHLQPAAILAREHIEAARPAMALRAMVGLESHEEAERFEAAARSDASTYREIVDALGPNFEGGYYIDFRIRRMSSPMPSSARWRARCYRGSDEPWTCAAARVT